MTTNPMSNAHANTPNVVAYSRGSARSFLTFSSYESTKSSSTNSM